jgi:hypothetical protein
MQSVTACALLATILVSSGSAGVRQSEPKKSDSTRTNSTERPAPPDWAKLVGSAERNKYHRLTCGVAQRIKSENVIWFADANDATENGYVAAGCNDKKCRPPAPDSGIEAGPIGGSGFPPPGPTPPEIPKMIAMLESPETAAPASSGSSNATPKSKKPAGPLKSAPPKSAPPPRMAARRESTPAQTWQPATPQQELAARRKWDVWAAWALERWCERWHVSPSGKIASNAAYTPDAERQLMARFAEMKGMIDQNKKRVTELEAVISGKKK